MQLVFIHGSGGCKESWHYQVRHFPDSDAIDLPGHPEGELCQTIEAYGEWLHAYIRRRGYEDVVLVGHSLGGGIALQVALDHAEDLAAIVLVGSGARLRVHPDYLSALERAVQNPSLAEQARNPVYDLIDAELAAVLRRRAAENGPAAALNDMRACDAFDVMTRLGSIELPALALCGDRDIMTPPKYSEYLAKNMPRARAVVIPGGTHMVFAEKPEEVNRAIEDFLAQLR